MFALELISRIRLIGLWRLLGNNRIATESGLFNSAVGIQFQTYCDNGVNNLYFVGNRKKTLVWPKTALKYLFTSVCKVSVLKFLLNFLSAKTIQTKPEQHCSKRLYRLLKKRPHFLKFRAYFCTKAPDKAALVACLGMRHTFWKHNVLTPTERECQRALNDVPWMPWSSKVSILRKTDQMYEKLW